MRTMTRVTKTISAQTAPSPVLPDTSFAFYVHLLLARVGMHGLRRRCTAARCTFVRIQETAIRDRFSTDISRKCNLKRDDYNF